MIPYAGRYDLRHEKAAPGEAADRSVLVADALIMKGYHVIIRDFMYFEIQNSPSGDSRILTPNPGIR